MEQIIIDFFVPVPTMIEYPRQPLNLAVRIALLISK